MSTPHFPWGKLLTDKINRRDGTRSLLIEFWPRHKEGLQALRTLIRDGGDVKIGRTMWRPNDGTFEFSPHARRIEAVVNLWRVSR